MNVAIVPGAPAPDSLSVSFQVADGLELVNGAELLTTDKPVEGAPLRHVIRILPKRDGIFALSAVVSAGPANQSPSRTFSIPVIAGEGLHEQVAKEPGVVGVAPFSINPMMLTHGEATATGVLLKVQLAMSCTAVNPPVPPVKPT